MKKFLRSPELLYREVPEELDRRILLAGAVAATRRRNRRKWRFAGALSGMAAAVAIATAALWPGVQTLGRMPSPSGRELLEISDWTSLEQENYNLCSQLNCIQDLQDSVSSQV